MLKRMFSLMLIGLLLNLTFYSTINAGNLEKEDKFAEKVKAQIAKLGIGRDAKVKVKLKDGTKIKGYVSQIADGNFTVINADNNLPTTIPYPQVKQVKGNKLSNGVKIVLVVGVILFLSLGFALSDTGV